MGNHSCEVGVIVLIGAVCSCEGKKVNEEEEPDSTSYYVPNNGRFSLLDVHSYHIMQVQE